MGFCTFLNNEHWLASYVNLLPIVKLAMFSTETASYSICLYI